MKKLLVLMLVLGMTSLANAGLVLSVDGALDPEDTTINLTPSETIEIDIHATNMPVGIVMGWITIQGPGSIDASNALGWEDSSGNNVADPPLSTYITGLVGYGYPGVVDIIEWDISDITEPLDAPTGKVLWNMIFHCDGLGDVTLTLMDPAFTVYDVQVIHNIPEPMTIALLGLGGLFLRRRR